MSGAEQMPAAAMLLQQRNAYIVAIENRRGGRLMSLIEKWALQLAAMFLFGWAAAVTAGWSGGIVNGDGSERLAQLTEAPPLLTDHAK
jgi:hypothetical protein